MDSGRFIKALGSSSISYLAIIQAYIEAMNVIMFHSVGSDQTSWTRNWLSIEEKQFEVFCKYLNENNYKSHFLDYWLYLQSNINEASTKDVFLTFDDGYLDNFLVAFHILKKYSLKATFFINPEFVDPNPGIRTRKHKLSSNTLGYLSWDELQFLYESGMIDIQSHSMSHNFYFCSDKVIDIYDGQDQYCWMSWIERPDRKAFWQTEDQRNFVTYGIPIFEYGRALGVRRYFPDQELVNLALALRSRNLPRDEIIRQLNKLKHSFPGYYESESEMAKRYWYELLESKKILEEKLCKAIDFLCWPGGAYNDLSLALSKKAGYKASTISPKDKDERQEKGLNYKRIKRFGLSAIHLTPNGEALRISNKRFIKWQFLAKRGSKLHKLIIKIVKVINKNVCNRIT